MQAPRPANEEERLAKLFEYDILDPDPVDAFDDLVRLAAQVCGVPAAALTFLDRDWQWFKSRVGFDIAQVPRDLSLCAHAILSHELTFAADASLDPRFRDSPFVAGGPGVRFYAAAPLVTPDGFALGTLCVYDFVSRTLSPAQQEALEGLARLAVTHLELRRHAAERRQAEDSRREQERQLRAVTDNVPVLIARVNRDRRYVFANRAYEDRLLLTPDQVLGHTMAEVLGEAAYETVRSYVDRALAGETVVYERTLDYRTVGPRVAYVTYVPERDSGGDVVGFVLSAIDITERRRAEEALREREQLLRSVLTAIPHHVFWKDRDGVYLGCNDNLARAVGLTTAADLIGKRDDELCWTPEEVAAFRDRDRRVMETGVGVVNEEQPARLADGTLVTGLTSKLPLRDAEGRIVGVLGTYHDITDRKALEAEREALLAETKRLLAEAVARADRDPLTGLLNHRAFYARLEQEADRAQREGGSLVVVMMDLNNFKFFNDAYGHLAGDEVLRQVAAALQGFCRSYDTLARFGGDEFALLMPGVSVDDAERQARRVVDSLSGLGYCPPGHGTPIPLSLSAGVAVFPDEAAGRLEAVDLADSRLRTAKTGGDAAVVAAEQVRREMAVRIGEFTMLDALVTAVDNKDRYTRRHSEDVLTYSALIASSLGLDEETRHSLAVAALLHDVGKIGVPDAVLRKPGKLTPAEMDAMRQHSQMGAVIVSAVPGFEDTLDAIRHHHERWDGGGYPFGLRGEDIPLTARLLAVADAFSAMTTDRPYRKGISEEQALAILRDGAGSQWDPACVRAFLAARSLSRLQL